MKFDGNYWERPLCDDEYTILWCFWIGFAYFWDAICLLLQILLAQPPAKEIFSQFKLKWTEKRQAHKYPATQGPRKMVKLRNNIQFIGSIYLFGYAIYHYVL